MNYNDLVELCALWLAFKQQSHTAIRRMRAVEDRIKMLAEVPDKIEGIYLVSAGPYTIKVISRDGAATTAPRRPFFTIIKED